MSSRALKARCARGRAARPEPRTTRGAAQLPAPSARPGGALARAQPGSFQLSATEQPDLCAPSADVTPLVHGLGAADFARLGYAGASHALHARGDTCALTSRVPPDDSPDALYSLRLPAPASLEVHTCSADGSTAFDTVLHLVSSCFGSADSAELTHAGYSHLMRSCPEGMRGAKLALALAAGDYTIAVSSESAACGRYELSVTIAPESPSAEKALGSAAGEPLRLTGSGGPAAVDATGPPHSRGAGGIGVLSMLTAVVALLAWGTSAALARPRSQRGGQLL